MYMHCIPDVETIYTKKTSALKLYTLSSPVIKVPLMLCH